MRKPIALLVLFFFLLVGAYAIGFAPSTKTVYFSNGAAQDYFTFSNPLSETYTCSIETTPIFTASYSAGNPFTTSDASLQIIGSYSISPTQLPMSASMSISCTKGSGGQQSIVNKFSRSLTFQVATTTTTLPPTTIPTTTTTTPLTTSSSTSTTITPITTTTTSTAGSITSTTKPTTTTTLPKATTSLPHPITLTTISRPLPTTQRAPVAPPSENPETQPSVSAKAPTGNFTISPANFPILAILVLVMVSGGLIILGISK